jgi:Uma2 family endonuclease
MSVRQVTYSEVNASRAELIRQLPPGTQLALSNVAWEDYLEIIEMFPNETYYSISYNDGRLEAMTASTQHEKFGFFIDQLVTVLKLRLRLNILSFGRATIKKSVLKKGLEPDSCYYVQRAGLLGNRIILDFEQDPASDIAVEVDVFHHSKNKFAIYAALDVREIWVYESGTITIHLLQNGQYEVAAASRALPMLTADILTHYLERLIEDGELAALTAFEEWLQTQTTP